MLLGSSSIPAPIEAPPATGAPVAVIDIGSNSVRLVVFDELSRTPFLVTKEKVLCGLGHGIAETGRLNLAGVERARAAIERFVGLARGAGAPFPLILATAAVREAVDGPAFVADLERRLELPVTVLDGDAEAALAAGGVLFGIPEADGVVMDLGGGSLELVRLEGGEIVASATLPVGPLRLAGLEAEQALAHCETALSSAAWLADGAGARLYAVGGGPRALARAHMARIDHPLRMVDHYTMTRAEIDQVARTLLHGDSRQDGVFAGVPLERRATLPLVAAAVIAVLRRLRPSAVLFSAHGVREGLIFERLSAAMRRQDPLLASSAKFARREAPESDLADVLFDWMTPLFPTEDAAMARLRRAACTLSEVGWSLHPEYRAEGALNTLLYAPLIGIDHPARAFIGHAVYARHGGAASAATAARVASLLMTAALHRAAVIGNALRLGRAVLAAETAAAVRLTIDPRHLTLRLAGDAGALGGEAVELRLAALARLVDRRPRLAFA